MWRRIINTRVHYNTLIKIAKEDGEKKKMKKKVHRFQRWMILIKLQLFVIIF
ncbi:hypothetical protein Hanom_Chr01g00033671 [Helianthus anomalus]